MVVGDGETPMARLASALSSGKRPLLRVLGPEAVAHPGAMPPVDWELLSRYRSTARSAASQAEIYLSRGCSYDCAFCMERAKRDTSWRALDPAEFPFVHHIVDEFAGHDDRDQFRAGLDLLLAGLALQAGRPLQAGHAAQAGRPARP